MKLKQRWISLSNQKKTLLYWIMVILIVDLGLAIPKMIQFFQTGQCRNYMVLNSPMQACSVAQFAQYGHGWMTFTNFFALVPAALIMIFASNILDTVFAKKDK